MAIKVVKNNDYTDKVKYLNKHLKEIWRMDVNDLIIMSDYIETYGTVDLYCELIVRLLLAKDTFENKAIWSKYINMCEQFFQNRKLAKHCFLGEDDKDPKVEFIYSPEDALKAFTLTILICHTILHYENNNNKKDFTSLINRLDYDTAYTDKDFRINGNLVKFLSSSVAPTVLVMLDNKPEGLWNVGRIQL